MLRDLRQAQVDVARACLFKTGAPQVGPFQVGERDLLQGPEGTPPRVGPALQPGTRTERDCSTALRSTLSRINAPVRCAAVSSGA